MEATNDFTERMNWLTQMWNMLLIYLNQDIVDIERDVQLVLSQTLESMLIVSIRNVTENIENAR